MFCYDAERVFLNELIRKTALPQSCLKYQANPTITSRSRGSFPFILIIADNHLIFTSMAICLICVYSYTQQTYQPFIIMTLLNAPINHTDKSSIEQICARTARKCMCSTKCCISQIKCNHTHHTHRRLRNAIVCPAHRKW